MKKHFWIVGGAIVALLALGALATTTMAASKDTPSVDGSQTFYACMTRPQVHLVSSGSIVPDSITTNQFEAISGDGLFNSCFNDSAHYTIVSWNGAGQPGPAGPQGATGAQGAPGISGYQVVQTIGEHAAPNQYVSATCPGTDVVLGGGAEVLSSSTNFPINDSQPTSNNHAWRASYSSANGKRTSLIVWATCAKVTA